MKISNTVNLYSCTKPIQWFNVENLFNVSRGEKNILLVMDSFPNVKKFVEKIKHHFPHWDEIHIIKRRIDIPIQLLKFKPNKLFIDADYGFHGYVQTLFFKGEVYVYEEGIGAYYFNVENLNVGKFKKFLFNTLGCGISIGSHYKTKGIYLYNPLYYKFLYPFYNNEVIRFEFQFAQALNNKMSILLEFFDAANVDFLELKGKKIAIYATRHSINHEIIDFLIKNKSYYDLVYIKPHPHLIKNDSQAFKNIDFPLIINNLMLEIVIAKLSLENHVTIFHECSTGCLYFKNSENIELVNYGGELTSYFLNFQTYNKDQAK